MQNPNANDIKTTYATYQNTNYPSLTAFARNQENNITGGIQILIDPKTHNKASIDIPKKAFGQISGSFVQISNTSKKISDKIEDIYKPIESTVTIIAEGIETALSINQVLRDKANIKILCSLGIHNIKNYKPLPNETIIIAKDNDGPNTNTNKIIDNAVYKLRQTTLVSVVSPKEIGDFNDVLQKEGSNNISKQFMPVIDNLKKYNHLDIKIICENRTHTEKTNLNDFLKQHERIISLIKSHDPFFNEQKLLPLADETRLKLLEFHRKNFNHIITINQNIKFAIDKKILTSDQFREYAKKHDSIETRIWSHRKCRTFVHENMYHSISELERQKHTIFDNKKFYNKESLLKYCMHTCELSPYISLTAKQELSQLKQMQKQISTQMQKQQEHHIEHEHSLKL